MQKKNIFQKNFNKSVISITKRIESFFNFLRVKFFIKKKRYSIVLNTIDNRIFLALAVILMTVITYFLLPAFYDKNKIKAQIETEILEAYDLNVKINKTLRYGIFPKPHFISRDVIIEYNSNDVAQSNNFKVFISVGNFFSLDKLMIKNLIFKKTDFKIESSNFKFFIDLLNIKKNDQSINFIDSKFFYMDKNDEVLFISNLKKLNFFYQEKLIQKLNSKFEIFNIPLNLFVKNNINEKKFYFETKSHPLRLNVKNETSYNNKVVNGEIDLSIINKNKKVEYTLEDNLLNFSSRDKKIFGNINIIPFYFSTNLNIYQINLKSLSKENSILVNILKSEFLNNENLSGKIYIIVKNLKGVNFLDETKFDVTFENGEILIQNLKTNFKKSVIINLNDTVVFLDDNKLKFAGYVNLDFINVGNIYKHYQINKNYRKKLKKINFGFLFNLDEKSITIDNLEIDGKADQKLDEFLNDFNFKKENILNKVIRRNLVKNFFKNFTLD